ncbi:metal ABC transporter solute-binding protein [Companilactobacillus baiquanensis]|uniref:Metal ABC transporter solute-binding protein n=1 Tax=Companilactobacillus baiquanensis TaxID=2486005 RepID=A0ABW1US18_9LACO|nr:metal ABC transporter solute-binding protein [Companilactobacillus baiquanensis]
MKKSKKIILTLGLILLSILLSSCSSKPTSQHSNKINIVTTTDFYGEVAKAVVGDKGNVTSIINNPAIDPHDYEPTTEIAKEVSRADITVANGIGYDSWMNKLSSDSSNAVFIKVGEDIMDKKSGDNPHLWYNPKTMPKYANYLAKELGKKQPKNKKYFKVNAQKYIDSLKPVNNELSKLRTTAKNTKNKDVYVSEPVFDYSIKAMGFTIGDKSFEKAIENGTDPSPKVVKDMRDGLKNKRISFLVYNEQAQSKTVDNLVQIAHKNNIPVLKVTETLPSGKTYKEWMLSQYKQLNKILKEKRVGK